MILSGDVDSGSVTYGGVDIKEMPLEWYMGQIAYVAQDNYLFDMSIKENIRLAERERLTKTSLTPQKQRDATTSFSDLKTDMIRLQAAGGHLSGGERQRICIARAMLKDAPVVILDEATAYTDTENEALVQSSVAKLVKGRTLIVIAHRLSTITGADKIFVINDGKVVASGKQENCLKAVSFTKKCGKHTVWQRMKTRTHSSFPERRQQMLKLVKKFFDFCNKKNRNKFYLSALLGVIEAIFTAMKIPAAYFAIKAVLEKKYRHKKQSLR